ncbi:PREDICTED: cathepsin B-like [Papilio xuthus]|uniref:Cathepsin B-like n=1 Tax=Papilio xuthus TaxID=66420 RepID=A0AAJ6Z5X3_PAPXU|nr:PREDICTED: cathepsin B-like [Papilio xuthus]
MFYFFVLLTVVAAFDIEIHNKYETLERSEFVEYFNSLNLTYKIGVESLSSDHKHCTFMNHDINLPTITHDVSFMALPESFDAREKWSNCPSIRKIYFQNICGSCWMFGTASTATDRNCIHANNFKDLSEQDLSCCTDCYENLCSGGNPTKAFEFWINYGLVSYDCQPYNYYPLMKHRYCSQTCVNGVNYYQDKNYGGRVYKVPSDEHQIKAELVTNGPIEATFVIYDDIMDYTHGVYVHKYGENRGYHSVRIIGYGEEEGVKYWLIANSWGRTRGLNGIYKIKQFQPEIQMEDWLLAPMPKGF